MHVVVSLFMFVCAHSVHNVADRGVSFVYSFLGLNAIRETEESIRRDGTRDEDKH